MESSDPVSTRSVEVEGDGDGVLAGTPRIAFTVLINCVCSQRSASSCVRGDGGRGAR